MKEIKNLLSKNRRNVQYTKIKKSWWIAGKYIWTSIKQPPSNQGFWQVAEVKVKFCGSFWGKLHQKAIAKKRPIVWLFSIQILLEIDQFCTDHTSGFNVFLTEVVICSFNNNTLQKWTNGKAFNITASAQFFAS